MKYIVTLGILLVTMFGPLNGCTVATGHPPGRDGYGEIHSRINIEYERIERGIERGSLTRIEARGLKQELNHILNKIDRMKRDGYLDPREREIINRDLDRLDREITLEKRRPY